MPSFVDMLKKRKPKDVDLDEIVRPESAGLLLTEKPEEKPEEVLRGAKFKIKLITPTAFGTQIDFAKKYPEEEIEKVLTGFNIKIKDKSVFIVA